MDPLAQKKARLAELRAQTAELELEITREKAGSPPVGVPQQAPPAPSFDHVDYHQFRGNIAPPGLGWQRTPDAAALSTEELRASRAYARDLEIHSVEEVIAGCSDSLRRYGFCCVDHVVPREMVDAVYWELGDGQDEKLAAMSPEEKLRPGPDGQTRGMALLGPTLQPLFSQFVCHPAVVGIAQTILDSHVRIANSGSRNLSSDEHEPGDGRALWPGRMKENRGPLAREWHT